MSRFSYLEPGDTLLVLSTSGHLRVVFEIFYVSRLTLLVRSLFNLLNPQQPRAPLQHLLVVVFLASSRSSGTLAWVRIIITFIFPAFFVHVGFAPARPSHHAWVSIVWEEGRGGLGFPSNVLFGLHASTGNLAHPSCASSIIPTSL